MSPGEAVRERMITLLADPAKGLNPAFASNCQKRQIPVPMPGTQNQSNTPFDFSSNSASLFRCQDTIEDLEHASQLQYPCLIASAISSIQDQYDRPYGSIFFGEVTVNLAVYVAWYIQQTPADGNFESALDALEEAIFVVLNSNVYSWQPVVYDNRLDFTSRTPLKLCNDNQLIRRGTTARIRARVHI